MAPASSSQSCSPLGFSGKYYFVNSKGECERQSSFFGSEAVLNQGVGYAVVLGFGAFFAVFTTFLVRCFVSASVSGSGAVVRVISSVFPIRGSVGSSNLRPNTAH